MAAPPRPPPHPSSARAAAASAAAAAMLGCVLCALVEPAWQSASSSSASQTLDRWLWRASVVVVGGAASGSATSRLVGGGFIVVGGPYQLSAQTQGWECVCVWGAGGRVRRNYGFVWIAAAHCRSSSPPHPHGSSLIQLIPAPTTALRPLPPSGPLVSFLLFFFFNPSMHPPFLLLSPSLPQLNAIMVMDFSPLA